MGLARYEARIYLALVRRDSYTAAEVAREAVVPAGAENPIHRSSPPPPPGLSSRPRSRRTRRWTNHCPRRARWSRRWRLSRLWPRHQRGGNGTTGEQRDGTGQSS
ncbi:helix-turn-helix domain-containing protein [Actinacidiphila soli]|uniref:helix-turn-helix domain-containing protein n=1 Tax=Actinacidiphila soli TaxID=2487275 RepID=UPI0022450D1C|nr:helix-turn-helix domain-containing protein [Actinacidiphila soli]